jgi:hypothetical protein
MYKILIVWTDIPEIPEFIEVQATAKQKELIEQFNNKYINCDEIDPEIEDKMNEFFFYKDGNRRFVGSEDLLKNKSYDLIIYCGILC